MKVSDSELAQRVEQSRESIPERTRMDEQRAEGRFPMFGCLWLASEGIDVQTGEHRSIEPGLTLFVMLGPDDIQCWQSGWITMTRKALCRGLGIAEEDLGKEQMPILKSLRKEDKA